MNLLGDAEVQLWSMTRCNLARYWGGLVFCSFLYRTCFHSLQATKRLICTLWQEGVKHFKSSNSSPKLLKTWLALQHVSAVFYHIDQNVLRSVRLTSLSTMKAGVTWSSSKSGWSSVFIEATYFFHLFHLLRPPWGEPVYYASDAAFTCIQTLKDWKQSRPPQPPPQHSCFWWSSYSSHYYVTSYLSPITSGKCLKSTDLSASGDFCSPLSLLSSSGSLCLTKPLMPGHHSLI